jgi:hypothetical protein
VGEAVYNCKPAARASRLMHFHKGRFFPCSTKLKMKIVVLPGDGIGQPYYRHSDRILKTRKQVLK